MGRKIRFTAIALVLAAGGIWAALDLWGLRSVSLRQFDPEDVADWKKINGLLDQSWRSLWRAVN